MARLCLKLEGRPGQISIESFLKVMKEIPELLRELDCAVSRNRSGTLNWLVSELKTGSALVEIESQVVRGREDLSSQVAYSLTSGLSLIAEEAITPPLFSVSSVRRVLRIVRNLETDSNNGFMVWSPDNENIGRKALLTRDLEPIVQKLVSVHHRDIGAVEGTLELVSFRPKRFNVFDSTSRRVVKCDLPESLEELVKENLGETVEVAGVVSYNADAEPLSVKVDHLRTLGDSSSLPTIEDILGMAPDFTDDLSTEEFIRVIRGN